jgi:hypothetical protein
MPEAGSWPDTPWSTILKLRLDDPNRARDALRRILDTYYAPILRYMQRHAARGEEEEWAHAFIEKMIDDSLPAKADPTRPLHHYLIGSMRFFVIDQYRRGKAGPQAKGIEPDALEQRVEDTESVYGAWAEVLVGRALDRLAGPTEDGHKGPSPEDVRLLRMKYGVGGEPKPHSYDEIRSRLGRDCPDHEIDNAIRRTKKAMLEAMRAEMRLLLNSDAGMDEELWNLCQYL